MKRGDQLYLVHKYHRDDITVTVKSVGPRWVRFEERENWKMDRNTRAVFDSSGWPIGQCYDSQAAYEQDVLDREIRVTFRRLVAESGLLDMDAVRRAAETLGLELDA